MCSSARRSVHRSRCNRCGAITTAQQITDGALGLSLPVADPDTEVGRLAVALHTMLDRLRTALRRAEDSERQLRNFLADEGHELRTPLTAVQGFAEPLLTDPRDGRPPPPQGAHPDRSQRRPHEPARRRPLPPGQARPHPHPSPRTRRPALPGRRGHRDHRRPSPGPHDHPGAVHGRPRRARRADRRARCRRGTG
ncbi:histidine kinase dimerization/phospho-acceptor domain-containing protein [Streptomyces goshikiensis]|uniref:HAMP domain-containing protein n=1 Tax=Streptomyces goshikiensis TaxID=1942 RepID=UPI0036A18D7A